MKRGTVLVRDKDGVVHKMASANAYDMNLHKGWEILGDLKPEEVCDACSGTGTFNGETCWHCEGEQIDPTK